MASFLFVKEGSYYQCEPDFLTNKSDVTFDEDDLPTETMTFSKMGEKKCIYTLIHTKASTRTSETETKEDVVATPEKFILFVQKEHDKGENGGQHAGLVWGCRDHPLVKEIVAGEMKFRNRISEEDGTLVEGELYNVNGKSGTFRNKQSKTLDLLCGIFDKNIEEVFLYDTTEKEVNASEIRLSRECTPVHSRDNTPSPSPLPTPLTSGRRLLSPLSSPNFALRTVASPARGYALLSPGALTRQFLNPKPATRRFTFEARTKSQETKDQSSLQLPEVLVDPPKFPEVMIHFNKTSSAPAVLVSPTTSFPESQPSLMREPSSPSHTQDPQS